MKGYEGIEGRSVRERVGWQIATFSKGTLLLLLSLQQLPVLLPAHSLFFTLFCVART